MNARKKRPARITAGLVWFHRWLGLATCLVFALWFASGAVLLFQPFPSLPAADRIDMASPVDLDAVRLSPERAMAMAGGEVDSVKLVQRPDGPAYLLARPDGITPIDAAKGKLLPLLSPDQVGADMPPIEYDQWIVHNQFDAVRPIYRLPQGDDAGTVLYRSAVTGEYVQRTTAWQRGWNWAGAVLHWVYFTPLRSSFSAWDQTVWWVSLLCTLVALAGTILGVMRSITALKQKKPSWTFYRLRWMRWHHLVGLFAAVFVMAWIISGWLSMDHGRLFSRGQADAEQMASYQGDNLGHALQAITPGALASLDGSRVIEFTALDGAPALVGFGRHGTVKRVDAKGDPLDDRAVQGRISASLAKAWPQARQIAISPVPAGDMYAKAEGWPDTALRASLGMPALPDVYVDGRDGRILTVMDNSRAAYAWIYYAMHTYQVPGLTTRDALRKIIVLIPLMLGLFFSITGVVIGWKRLRKTF